MASRCSYVDGCRAQLTPFQLRANNVIQWLISRYVTSIILDIIFGSLIELESERDSFVCLSRMMSREKKNRVIRGSIHTSMDDGWFPLTEYLMYVYITPPSHQWNSGETADDKRFFFIVRLSRFCN